MDVASMSTEELDCRLHQLLTADERELDEEGIRVILQELLRREPEPT